MKVCLLCFSSSEKSGSGMDVYAWNILSRSPKEIEFNAFEYNRNGSMRWFLKEFVIPYDQIKLLNVDADIYHAVSPWGTKIALLARKRPIITTVHDLIPNSLHETSDYYRINSKRRRWLNPWYWWFVKKSDYIITSSELTKRDATRLLGIEPERISVVHYGTNHEMIKPVLRTGYNNPKTILYLGALDLGKGVLDLIKAFSIVAKELKDVNLLIGGRGNTIEPLKEIVNKLGLKERVKFLGFVPPEKLSYYYQLSDLYVFPSYLGVHLMLLDAMASGLPVIAGNRLDAPEYVGDGGWLVNPGDVHQLSEKIYCALTDRDKYVEMSKKAIKRSKNFSWDKTAQETIDVYTNFLSK